MYFDQEVKSIFLVCRIIFEKYFIKPTGLGELEELPTVMQTRDSVEGLHNSLEFSQLPSCLGEAINTEKVFH